MKIRLKKEEYYDEVHIQYIYLEASPRYWSDAEINGKEDDELGSRIPCNISNQWCPLINIHTGQIENWNDEPQGKLNNKAKIHYKVCDDLNVLFLDKRQRFLIERKQCYVPPFLCPKEEGYGDYIIMDIDENGFIKDWNVTQEDINKFLFQ
jgi:hypothetical protein